MFCHSIGSASGLAFHHCHQISIRVQASTSFRTVAVNPNDEIWPVVLVAASVVALLVILAFNDPGTYECVGACG